MFEKELESALDAARAAQKVIMDIYVHGFKVEIKSDKSPVTEADKQADKLIREVLHKAYPTYAFLTEESEDHKERLNNDYVWVVDPVDGTKDFVAKDDEFTTNIALAYKHEVVVGVVSIPAKNIIYYAIKNGGAFKLDMSTNTVTKIHVNDKTSDLTCLKSVFHSNEKEEALYKKYSDRITHVEKVGSSIKACYISEGKAEISYRLSDGTKEWDTAAFQIIVEEAGGYVLKLDKTRMTYNREDVYNHGGYIILNNLENFLL